MIERAAVKEWRITSTHGDGTVAIRYWIEADAEHGGIVEFGEARKAVLKAEAAADLVSGGLVDAAQLCQLLHTEIPATNAIEVTIAGQGVCFQWNWP